MDVSIIVGSFTAIPLIIFISLFQSPFFLASVKMLNVFCLAKEWLFLHSKALNSVKLFPWQQGILNKHWFPWSDNSFTSGKS